MGRRDFVRAAVAACAALVAAREPLRAASRSNAPLRIALAAGGESAARGVTLGAEEASRTGSLMGRTIELVQLGPDDAERWAREPGAGALLGGADEGAAERLADVAASAGIVFVNLGARDDALRARCRPWVFHVEASEAMYRDAAAARPGATAVLWHPSLERFGAAQLNDRFRARFGAPMDGAAWAGWMAVKVVWEASLRAGADGADALRGYLAREATQFDGHKGWPLSFRAWDHQLRQPLYLVSGDEVVGEVPARTGEGASSRDLLDGLGSRAATLTCTGP